VALRGHYSQFNTIGLVPAQIKLRLCQILNRSIQTNFTPEPKY
jgi:hypothetical protein